MASLAQLRDDTYFWLGTTSSNQAFPSERITRCLNIAKDALVADIYQSFQDRYLVETTLTSATRRYDLTAQTVAIRDVHTIVEVRERDSEGTRLEERPFSQLERLPGQKLYAVLGANAAMTIVAGPATAEGLNLYFSYTPMVADLSADADTITVVPTNFHDVISLKAAFIASGSGDEQRLSAQYVELLADREAQLRQHIGRPSLEPSYRRVA